jgi:hypothetical protein
MVKPPTQMLEHEHFPGNQLFTEYVKLEASDPTEKRRLFHEINDAPTIRAEIEERPFHPSDQDFWSAEQEDVDDEADEEHSFVKSLIEEMSSLETEHEQFEATAKVLRENSDSHAGKEE